MVKYQVAEHKVIAINGHDLFFLVAENAIFEVDPETKKILDQCASQGTLSKAEFLSCFDGSPEEGTELLQHLVDRHVLVQGADEMPHPKTAPGEIPIPLQSLVLHVTDDCNLDCLYCYYHQEGGTAEKKAPITQAVSQRAVDFLIEHSGNLENVVLVFFGGEPFLKFERVAAVVKYARKKAGEAGKRITFTITTNGTLFTEEIVDFLRENDIGVTVSIDGPAEIHDRYRCFIDGTPSYQAILPGIKRLLRATRGKPVAARVTVVQDPEAVPQTIDHLLGLGFSEVGFAPVTTRKLSYQLNGDGMTRLLDQFKILSGRFLEAALQDDFFGFSNLIDLLVVLHEGEIKNYPCGAGLGLFSVDTEGSLYLCQRLTGEDQWCMGSVFEGFDQEKVRQFRHQAEMGQKKPCRSCWARTTCAGGCYHEALIREGHLTRPNLHYCRWIRCWVELGLNVYGQIALNRPEYLDKLSALRGHPSIFNHYD